MVLVVKNPPDNAGDLRHKRFNPWVGKDLGRTQQPTPVFLHRIPWTEEPGGLQSTGSQSWIRVKQPSTHACNSKTRLGYYQITGLRVLKSVKVLY